MMSAPAIRPKHATLTEMLAAAEELKFEYAAKLRDEIKDLDRQLREVVS